MEKHGFLEASESVVAKAIVGAKRGRRVQNLRTHLESPQPKILPMALPCPHVFRVDQTLPCNS